MSKPLPHDGWKSRKVIVGVGAWLLVFAGCAVSLATGKATFDQVQSALVWITPSVLLPLMGSLSLDKLAESKRQ